jgi:hypothetical protein
MPPPCRSKSTLRRAKSAGRRVARALVWVLACLKHWDARPARGGRDVGDRRVHGAYCQKSSVCRGNLIKLVRLGPTVDNCRGQHRVLELAFCRPRRRPRIGTARAVPPGAQARSAPRTGFSSGVGPFRAGRTSPSRPGRRDVARPVVVQGSVLHQRAKHGKYPLSQGEGAQTTQGLAATAAAKACRLPIAGRWSCTVPAFALTFSQLSITLR